MLNPLFSQNERAIISRIDSLNTTALELYDRDEITQSIDYFKRAIKLSDSIDDNYGKAIANITLGSIFYKMDENDDAERSYLKALESAQNINQNHLIASSYLNIGNIYAHGFKLKNEAMTYYHNALKTAKSINVIPGENGSDKNKLLSKICLRISDIHLDSKREDEAFTFILRAQKHQEAIQNAPFLKSQLAFMFARYYAQKEALYNAIVNYDNAIIILERLDENNNERNFLISKIYKQYALSLANLEKDDRAFEALLKHNEYREKVINEEKVKQSKIAKAKFEIEDYKQDVQEANEEKKALAKVTENMQRVNTIIIVAVVFLIISLVALFIIYLSKKRLSGILQIKNKQLEIAKNEAEKVSKLKSGFISNVSHELRTPLYGVVGLTSLLLKNNNLNKQDSKYLKSLKYSGDYLLNLINDVLQIGKIESKKIELHNNSLNIKQMVINITDSFEYQLEEKSNKLHLEFDNKIPNFIFADNIRLSQILINLLGNGLKFTNKGNVWLKLKLLKENKDLASIRFEIIDDGPGIPKSQQKLIFENFSQLERKHNDDYQGTGLGLSIAKNLVELFGGEIELTSDEGLGSKFAFNITFEIDKAARAIEHKKSFKERLLENSGRKILIVEDNKINQIVTQNILKKENFVSDIVENGILAIDAAKEGQYDLILMDLNMPVMDGFQATKAIRDFDKETPIIALTASNIEEVKEQVFSSGFDDIIIKPYDDYEFYQTIIKNIQVRILSD